MVLERDAWPEWIEFRAGGYEPNRWAAGSHWFYHSQRFWMERLE